MTAVHHILDQKGRQVWSVHPDSTVYDAIKNRQERPDLEETLRNSLKALSVDEVVSCAGQHFPIEALLQHFCLHQCHAPKKN